MRLTAKANNIPWAKPHFTEHFTEVGNGLVEPFPTLLISTLNMLRITMSKEEMEYYKDHMKHWRAWSSWFSWGSPVGLGLFFISLAFSVWLLSAAFGWN
jgi:hypothetical protein